MAQRTEKGEAPGGSKGAPVASTTSGSGPGLPRRNVPLRPARISGRDEITVYVECRANMVIVHPTRRQIAVDTLTGTPNYNPLYQTVRHLIQKQRQAVKPGERVPRAQVRFLVHANGERTYHMAYPSLETLSVPKTRTMLQPEDDVARIVAGD